MTVCTESFAKSVLGIHEDDIVFSASKLFFAFGLGNSLYYPFAVGVSALYYPGRVTAEIVFHLVERYRPTLFFGAPTLYASLLALPEAEKRFDFSSVCLCVSAGEALAEELKAFVKSRLHPYKYPRWIEFLPELPKTATGKIRCFVLRDKASL
jgi:benzoate-CoA ligase